jgi:hypothetical protein
MEWFRCIVMGISMVFAAHNRTSSAWMESKSPGSAGLKKMSGVSNGGISSPSLDTSDDADMVKALEC